MDKKMYKYIGILVGLILLLIVFFWVTNLLTGGTKYSYERIEEKLVEATKNYTKKNPGALPTEPGTSVLISSSILINNGELKDFSEYTKDTDVVCTGSVEVYLSGEDNYNYVPDFNCGNKYNTVRLYDKVIADNDFGIVYGEGLYQRVDGKFVTREEDLDNFTDSSTFEYVFRGKDVNNYVKIDENYWRIVSINQDNDMLLIYVGHIQQTLPWDDRYNEDVNMNQGINDYYENGLKSVAMESVEKFYNGEVRLQDKEEYSSKTKYLTSPMNLCIGKRSSTDKDISGAIECKNTLEGQYVGLLPAYYYMSASLDDNCNSVLSRNCGNNNYLTKFNDYWWLLTASTEKTNEAYIISQKTAQASICSARSNIRPVILLGSRAVYESGIGTETDPYIVKFYE